MQVRGWVTRLGGLVGPPVASPVPFFCSEYQGEAQMLRAIWNDEKGGEVIEYALILGLIIVAAIAVIGSVGTKVLARWTSVNSSL